MPYTPSPQQSDFYDWVQNKYGSCVLEAVAGAGKTTTLVHGVSLMKGYIFMGAFNKKIAEEIKSKTAHLNLPNLTVGTLHSEGFKIWRKAAKGVTVDGKKCLTIFRKRVEAMKVEGQHDDAAKLQQFESQVLKLVSLAKQVGVGHLRTDRAVWFEIIDHHDIDCLDEDDFVVKAAIGLLKKSVSMDFEVVDFDDMIYSPLIHGCNPFKYDWVLIDEAQDTNSTRRALALLLLKKGGRLVAVGDRHQAIYGFTGADADALDRISSAVDAVRLPLTVTYRCPKRVVDHARKWVSHITCAESAPDGEVIQLDAETTIQSKAVPGDAVLCRFNAPLLTLVYQFIKDGVPAKIEGREIGNGLKQLASRWKVRSFDGLEGKLEKYVERETQKYVEKDQQEKIQALTDKIECLGVIINRCRESKRDEDMPVVQRLCNEIDRIFDDEVSGKFVTLSSIHKSKGREWENVFWLQTGPSKWAKKAWEQEQEKNLCYVATTRAMKRLYLSDAQGTMRVDRKVEDVDKTEVK